MDLQARKASPESLLRPETNSEKLNLLKVISSLFAVEEVTEPAVRSRVDRQTLQGRAARQSRPRRNQGPFVDAGRGYKLNLGVS
jgi:hypothetical protein